MRLQVKTARRVENRKRHQGPGNIQQNSLNLYQDQEGIDANRLLQSNVRLIYNDE